MARHQLQQRLPVARETVLQQGQGGVFAANRQQATHFLSPGASAPAAPHVMTPHDRQVLRQQIQSASSGNLPQPPSASNAAPNPSAN
jgi:hypothetical protein